MQSYPPNGTGFEASRTSLGSDEESNKKGGATVVDMRDITRTPSPTPSESEELKKTNLIDWKAMGRWKFWIRREWLWYYVICIFGLVLVILFTVFHDKIVRWLQPAANWMHKLPFGWLIPIAILFVISFPPLFGHEIIGILCGLVWGLGVGFAIVAVGTFLGEVGNFYAFRYCLHGRAEKWERTKIMYACLAKVVREGGFKIALIIRLSAIPGHFTTAVFSTCGMSIFTFAIAAVLSLPKQFITVYLGVAMEQSENGGGSRTDTIVKDIVIGITVLITIGAMWYVNTKLNQAKPAVIYEKRKARQAKLMAEAYAKGNGSSMSVTFNPNVSEAEIPLTAHAASFDGSAYQQWDENGRAVGYAPDPSIFVPVPRRAQPRPFAAAPTHRPQPGADSAYQMSERPPYQPASPVRQTAYSRPTSPVRRQNTYQSDTGDSALPNPFAEPVRPPSRPTYTAPPLPPPPMSPTQPLAPQHTPRTAPAYAPAPAPYAGAPPSSAPFSAPYAAPPYSPPPPAQQPYATYESTTSIQSQAGSLPPSYSGASLR
ncbi:hypothetical protein IEO21_06689 [Rhodonia placenta]|uniref:Golgi apparatus membrane protein TVP38 n=2 Tax=Rhodonia placenta TaxID=104341 RepID=A0A8H7U123_9APHY|nr:hypothetical protein IEO21_06689 [Postia placenta]